MIHIMAPRLFIWCGLLIGVSFVATPAKFLAPSLQLPHALDLGRWTFHVLSLVEGGLMVVVGLLLWACRHRVAAGWGSVMVLLIAIAAVLAAETFLMRPVLDARVLHIMAGRSVPPSVLHDAYVALEAPKLVLTLAAAIASTLWVPDAIGTPS